MRTQGAIRAQTLAVLAIAALGPGCTAEEPCNGLKTLADFRACEKLCGSASTATTCDWQESPEVLDLIAEWNGHAVEMSGRVPPAVNHDPSRYVATWEPTDLGSIDAIEIPSIPLWDEAGVLATDPPPMVRVTKGTYPQFPEGVTFYLHAIGSGGDVGCALRYGVVMHWIPATDSEPGICMLGGFWDVSTIVIRTDGKCPNAPRWGKARKREGIIVVSSLVSGSVCPQVQCGADGTCNQYCEIDRDCPCHNDGECDFERCPGDANCSCDQDFHCVPSCSHDPDCACLADGSCNPACRATDLDCECSVEDGCNVMCMSDDPDCGCQADEACNQWCGIFDPDCACADDGICNEDCVEIEDPDCGGGG